MHNKLLIFASLGEVLTGLALIVAPSFVGQLLFAEHLAGMATVAARVAGIALIGLGISLWPGPAVLGMLTYSALVAFYLAYVGLSGPTGAFLWPVVILHAILAVLLTRVWRANAVVRD